MNAVIMAGGQGRRLAPYSTILPKALMPIGDVPIIEIIIRQLERSHFKRIIIATGYLSELITAYLNQKTDFNIKISFHKEKDPLGTFGAISKIKGLGRKPFFVINGDELTTINYNKLCKFHKDNRAALTVAIHKRVIDVDYGVIEVSKENQITKHSEKPKIKLLVGMGIYVVDPLVMKYLNKNEKIGFPDVLGRLIADKQKVVAYLSNDYWMDIAHPDDYEKAVKDYIANPCRFLGNSRNGKV